MTSLMRCITPRAVSGLARNSVTPAIRASSRLRRVAWPVIMMIGAYGFGLACELRTQCTNDNPSTGCIIRSVNTMSTSRSENSFSPSTPSPASRMRRTPADFRIADRMPRMLALSSMMSIVNARRSTALTTFSPRAIDVRVGARASTRRKGCDGRA
ncbi:conserved hypothetical protein [Ricinus communis]|uniref:Uncharacterized protein n=1 Tax=Ricinus communis TaxID=3988 RepID=B9TJ49_RICCO|nr:conserved hypothetical protein [Ricinus communis]